MAIRRTVLAVALALGTVVLGAGSSMSEASAQTCPDYTCNVVPTVPTQVLGEELVRQPSSVTNVVPAAAPAGGTPLPFTGADVVELSGVGLAVIVAGSVLIRTGRARPDRR